MLRGSYTARIDDKGRLKMPTRFLRYVLEKYGAPSFYITSLTGEQARLYPLREWEAIEQQLILRPTFDPIKRKVLDFANYYGQEVELDNQGRLLLPQMLRRTADLCGDVTVMGYLSYLEVWDLTRFQQRLANAPFEPADEAALTALGI